MKLHLFNYVCRKCGHKFKAPEMNPEAYGEFLLRSPSGEVVYLNAISDPVYQEVDELLKVLLGESVSPVKRAELQREIFGLACDVDSSGKSFSINAEPVCPSCGAADISYWEATDPPEYVEKELDRTTHSSWSRLSKDEKRDCLARAIKEH